LVAELAVWRAARGVEDTDLRAAGPGPTGRSGGLTYNLLQRRIKEAHADDPRHSAEWWARQVRQQARVTQDPWWPVLAARLDELALHGQWLTEDDLSALEARLAVPAADAGLDSVESLEQRAPDAALGDSPVEASALDPARRARLVEAQRAAAAFFADHLERSWVPGYLQRRGFPNVGGVGYAPRGARALVHHLLAGDRFTAEELLDAGLATLDRQGRLLDRFRDRMVFTIYDTSPLTGEPEPVGFAGRKAEDAPSYVPKYLNTNATEIYDKSAILDGLAENLDLLRRGATPVIVEGILDAKAVTAATGGRMAGLAPGGTALTPQQVAVLGRVVDLATTPVIVATDADTAGRTAASRDWQILTDAGVPNPRAATLPAGDDPAKMIEDQRGEELAQLLDATTPLLLTRVEEVIGEFERVLDDVGGQLNLVRALRPILDQASEEHRSWGVARILAATSLDPELTLRELDGRPVDEDEAAPDVAPIQDVAAAQELATAQDVSPVRDQTPSEEPTALREAVAALFDQELATPLPDEQPAAALWARLRAVTTPRTFPRAANGLSTPERQLLARMDPHTAADLLQAPEWPLIDDRIRADLRDGQDDTLTTAMDRAAAAGGATAANILIVLTGHPGPDDNAASHSTQAARLARLEELRERLTQAREARERAAAQQRVATERIREERPDGPRLGL